MQNLISQLCHGDLWLPWLPLRKGEMKISNGEGGLYRIRMRETCVYVGETENFKRRVEQELLRSLQVETMPNGEHHTASPGLWHLQRTYGNDSLQVSLAPLASISSAQRKGLESLAIAVERRNHQRSPILNYGRMPDGLAKPKRAKARSLEPDIGDESVAPVGNLFDPTIQQVQSDNWGGHHEWSDWTSVSALRREKAQGLYRLRNARDLVIIGHGAVAHAASFDTTLTCSFVSGPWSRGQRREIVDDLVALYLLSNTKLPSAQFGGQRNGSEPERDGFIQYLHRIEEAVTSRLWFPQVDIAS